MFKEACPRKNELWTVRNLILWTSRSVFDSKQAKTIIGSKIECRSKTDRKTCWGQGTLRRDETTLNRLVEFRVRA